MARDTGTKVTSAADIPELSAPERRANEREVFVYEVPPNLVGETGIEAIGLVIMTAEEELMAAKRTRGDAALAAMELTKQALRQVKYAGQRTRTVSSADSSIDEVWSRMHPKVRGLCIVAYNDLHNAKQSDVVGFLQSRKATVG